MQKIKRFYEAATVGRGSDGYAILLDGRAVRTPGKATLEVGSAVLAEAIAEEWQAQDEEVDPTSMPMNNLACTAIDIVTPRQQEIVEDLAGYGGHDLICYWTDESGDLLSRQQQHWQPLLDWAAQSLSAPLLKTCGVVSQDQPPASLAALRTEVERHDTMALTGLAAAVQTSGSLVIGLAVFLGRLDAEQAYEISQLDEIYQGERWGEDAEATARRQALLEDMRGAARFLALVRQGAGDTSR